MSSLSYFKFCILFLIQFLIIIKKIQSNNLNKISTNNNQTHINILLLLPTNDSYKFSLNKVLSSLNLAINDIESSHTYGTKYEIDLITDTCDCTGIKAPVNAMENIFGKRNHSKRFHAVFGPMCD
jgi:hypothetical protein